MKDQRCLQVHIVLKFIEDAFSLCPLKPLSNRGSAAEVMSSLGCEEKWVTWQTLKNTEMKYISSYQLSRQVHFSEAFPNKARFFVLNYGILTLFNTQVLSDSYAIFPSPTSKCLYISTQRLVQSSDTTAFSFTQDSQQHSSSTPPYSQLNCCSHLSCSMAHIFPSHMFLPHHI